MLTFFIKQHIQSPLRFTFDPSDLIMDPFLTCKPCPAVSSHYMSSKNHLFISGIRHTRPPWIPSAMWVGKGRGRKGEEEEMGFKSPFPAEAKWCSSLQSIPNIPNIPMGLVWLGAEWDGRNVGCSQSPVGLWASHYSLIDHLQQPHQSTNCSI